MITEKELLEYTTANYPTEHELIGRTMVNYYTLKLKENKTDGEQLHQDKLFAGVMDLFEILSNKLATEVNGTSEEIFNLLKAIHIKT